MKTRVKHDNTTTTTTTTTPPRPLIVVMMAKVLMKMLMTMLMVLKRYVWSYDHEINSHAHLAPPARMLSRDSCER
jgi:uncharacterized integral membrane protein